MNFVFRTGATLALCMTLSPAFALDVQISNNLLMFGGATKVSISGPGDYAFDSSIGRATVKSPNGNLGAPISEPNLSFATPQELGIVADGTYTFQATEVVLGASSVVNDPTNGRNQVSRRAVQSVSVQSGSFTVLNGAIVDSTISE